MMQALELPPGALPVRPEEMPEVSRVLEAALLDLGAAGVSVWLDPTGAAEAWLAREDALVLGAGALSLFGPVELTYLVALALALGEQGALLVSPGEVAGLASAAAAAFTAVPSPPAAARVLLWLDPVARGADADTIDTAAVLTASTPLAAVIQRALALV
jgi:hypothetical protein